MKKILRPQSKGNKRTNRRVVMVKSIRGFILNPQGDLGDSFRAQLVNVSSTGCQVYSNKAVDNSSFISLELGSLDGSHVVAYMGKVVWARKNPMKSMGRFAYGVNFEKMTPEHTKFLETNYSLSEQLPTLE
jgi:c-di-GMP-binding flagellar brake protein YcgR